MRPCCRAWLGDRYFGRRRGADVAFFVTADASGLFAEQPAIAADGTLTFRLAQNANGVATVTAYLKDNGGTGSGGNDSSGQETFSITIQSLNDAPVIVVPEPQTTDANTPLVFSSGNGNLIRIEDPDANGLPIRLTCSVVNGMVNLAGISGLVTLSGTGNGDAEIVAEGTIEAINAALNGLSFIPNENYNGPATINVSADDNGNSGEGGAKQTQQAVRVDVIGVNAAPTFKMGTDVTIDEDAGAQIIAGWATEISPGSVWEIGQELMFLVGNDNPDMFLVEPVVSADGDLSFTCANNVYGIANVTVVLMDNAGTLSGGEDTSEPYTFAITVNSVNDIPMIHAPAPLPGAMQDSDFEIDYQMLLGLTEANDIEGDPITFRITAIHNGALSIDGDVIAVGAFLQPGQKLVWHPEASAIGAIDAFEVAVSDGEDQSDSFVVQIIVSPLLCVQRAAVKAVQLNLSMLMAQTSTSRFATAGCNCLLRGII